MKIRKMISDGFGHITIREVAVMHELRHGPTSIVELEPVCRFISFAALETMLFRLQAKGSYVLLVNGKWRLSAYMCDILRGDDEKKEHPSILIK